MQLIFVAIAFVVIGLILVKVAEFIKNNKTGSEGSEKQIDMPYSVKVPFFSKSELEFFRILNSHLDAHRYTLFPKVRLADFVKVNGGNGVNYASWNRIKSKHVDYLVWDLAESKVVLAIELDGKSHDGHVMSKSDSFKNEMYKGVGLQLIRVRVGSSFAEESERISQMLSIR